MIFRAHHSAPCGQSRNLLDNAFRRQSEMAVKVANRTGLPDMLDTQRDGPVAADRAEPGQRSRVAVDDGDQVAMRRQAPQKGSHRRLGIDAPARARVAQLSSPRSTGRPR